MRCIYADQWNHVRRELFELQSLRIVMENRISGQRTARSTSKMPVSITRRSTGCSASTICITGMTISSVALQNRVSVKNKSNHQLTSGNVQNFFRNEISKKGFFYWLFVSIFSVIGTVLVILVGYPVSILTGGTKDLDPKLLSPLFRGFYKKNLEKSITELTFVCSPEETEKLKDKFHEWKFTDQTFRLSETRFTLYLHCGNWEIKTFSFWLASCQQFQAAFSSFVQSENFNLLSKKHETRERKVCECNELNESRMQLQINTCLPSKPCKFNLSCCKMWMKTAAGKVFRPFGAERRRDLNIQLVPTCKTTLERVVED